MPVVTGLAGVPKSPVKLATAQLPIAKNDQKVTEN